MCITTKVFRCGHYRRERTPKNCACSKNNGTEKRIPKFCNQWFCNKKTVYSDTFCDNREYNMTRRPGLADRYLYAPWGESTSRRVLRTHAHARMMARWHRRVAAGATPTFLPGMSTRIEDVEDDDVGYYEFGPTTPPRQGGLSGGDDIHTIFHSSERNNHVGTPHLLTVLNAVMDASAAAAAEDPTFLTNITSDSRPSQTITQLRAQGLDGEAVPRTFRRRGARSAASGQGHGAGIRAEHFQQFLMAEGPTELQDGYRALFAGDRGLDNLSSAEIVGLRRNLVRFVTEAMDVMHLDSIEGGRL